MNRGILQVFSNTDRPIGDLAMSRETSIRGSLRSSRNRWCAWAGVWLMSLAFWASPTPPARADMFTPSVRDQIRLGDQAAAEVMRKYRVINDDRSRTVEQVGFRLLDSLPPKQRGPWNYRFYLIE